jgi:hypothetical protein
MQQQLQRQTQNLFGNFPFSGFTAPQNPASGNDTKNEPDASSDKK